MAAMQVTLENIAPSKLLNYVQKQTLVDFVSPKKYAEVEHRLRQQLEKSKITLRDMKQHLATSPQFIQSLRNGVEAFNKYQHAVERLCAEWITAKRRQSERS
jgi:predicted nucleic acid-binding protein